MTPLKLSSFKFSGKVWRYPGTHSTGSGQAGGWHFVTLDEKLSSRIRKAIVEQRPWGYVKVGATIGKTSWQTGLWPQAKAKVYLLVIKAPVRSKEGIREGDSVKGNINLL